MPDLLHRVAAKDDDHDPLLKLAVELADHVAACPTCQAGNAVACAPGLALVHAVAAARAKVEGQELEG